MAKQPSADQLDQLVKDLRVTADKSDFPEIRRLATDMLPDAERLARKLRDYRRLTD